MSGTKSWIEDQSLHHCHFKKIQWLQQWVYFSLLPTKDRVGEINFNMFLAQLHDQNSNQSGDLSEWLSEQTYFKSELLWQIPGEKKRVSSKDLHRYVSNLAPLWPPHSRQRTSSSSSSALALSSTISSAISLLIASKSSMSWFHLDKSLPICRVSVNTTRLKNQEKLSQGRGIHWDRLTIRLFALLRQFPLLALLWKGIRLLPMRVDHAILLIPQGPWYLGMVTPQGELPLLGYTVMDDNGILRVAYASCTY